MRMVLIHFFCKRCKKFAYFKNFNFYLEILKTIFGYPVVGQIDTNFNYGGLNNIDHLLYYVVIDVLLTTEY